MFSVYSPKKRFNANEIEFGGKYPYVARGSENNGIRGFTTQDEKYLSEGNTISFGQDTATIYYQSNPYFTGDKIKIMKLIDTNLSENIANFLITSMRKSFSTFGWGVSSFNEEVLNNVKIKLPLTSQNEIDFSYMENYIQQIQNERFSEVKQFIKENNYENCELTEAEKKAILDFENGNIKFAEFKIGDLFEKLKMGMKKKTFNKSEDVSDNRSEVYSLPLVNAKHGNNGIMYYGKESDFDSVEMSIDIVGDGAIATGDVYPQPQKTGVLYNAYLIKFKKTEVKMNSEILFYLACSLQKSIKLKFGYDNKASWEKVKEEYFNLPLNSQNTIDYSFMENYILAQKKCVMKNVVEFV